MMRKSASTFSDKVPESYFQMAVISPAENSVMVE
jgi:hypothetical protein